MARIRRVRDGGELSMLVLQSAAILGVAVAACVTRRAQIFGALIASGAAGTALGVFAPRRAG
jgi:hypothetical protein